LLLSSDSSPNVPVTCCRILKERDCVGPPAMTLGLGGARGSLERDVFRLIDCD
jgi:hypothetical protein